MKNIIFGLQVPLCQTIYNEYIYSYYNGSV